MRRDYDSRVARIVKQLAEQRFGHSPPHDVVLALVRNHMLDAGRPSDRNEFAEYMLVAEKNALVSNGKPTKTAKGKTA